MFPACCSREIKIPCTPL